MTPDDLLKTFQKPRTRETLLKALAHKIRMASVHAKVLGRFEPGNDMISEERAQTLAQEILVGVAVFYHDRSPQSLYDELQDILAEAKAARERDTKAL